MNVLIKGALDYLESSWKAFEHNGQQLTKDQVRHLLTRALAEGYETTDDLPAEKWDLYLLEWVSGQLNEKPKETMFRANFCQDYGERIQEFEIVSKTTRTVTVKNSDNRTVRFNIFSQNYSFYDTWEQAKEALVEITKINRNNAFIKYEKLKTELQKLTDLKKP